MRAATVLIVLLALALPARAVTLLRDADIEYGLKQLASPILRAAGLSPNRVKILAVDDGSLNAFVVGQDAIFIHSGLIGKLGQTGMAALVTAERYALSGPLDDAGIHARRASDLLPDGSGPWQRAQDVLIASEREAKKRNR